MSIFGSLGIGARGLSASQLAMNVLGQNISNANTEGYSRKRLELNADTRQDSSLGEMGFGVEVSQVSRISDGFLEVQIREKLTEQGYFAVLDEGLERLENIFTEPSDAGLNESMNKFWSAWQDLANNPDDPASREVVKASTLVLQDKFHTLDSQLSELRKAQDEEIEGKVAQVNGIANEIYELNQEVAMMEVRGGSANDSRDRRDMLVQELAGLVDIYVIEDELGRQTITTSGNVIVGPSTVVPLEIERRVTTDSLGDSYSQVTVRFANSKKTYVPKGGELKGNIEMRDAVVAKFRGLLDELAGTFVKNVNSLHAAGYNLNEGTGTNFFSVSDVRAKNIGLSAAIMDDSANIAAAAGGTVEGPIQLLPLPSVPASGTPLDLKLINPQFKNLLQGSVQVEHNGQLLEEGAGKDYVVDYQNGTVVFMNYGRYAPGDPINLSFSRNSAGYPGPGDGNNALAIAQLRDQFTMGTDNLGNPNKTIGEFYNSFIGVLGIERNQTKSNRETRNFLVDQFKVKKQEVSGVSLDEELGNMIKFEHTYQASARFMRTINDLMDTLMNI